MIVWISSYPKSGNTYIRSFLSSYYFSDNGKFDFDLLHNILQFPSIKFSKKDYFSFNEAAQNWIYNQNYYFNQKKFLFMKTHNTLKNYQGEKFTTSKETIGAIYIVRDPRNIITSMCHHYSFSFDEAYSKLVDVNASLSEKSANGDCSNFTYLGSWAEHYKSWKNTKAFKVLFIRYEDLQNEKYEIFKKIINFINNLKNDNSIIDENKLSNSIKSTNFSNLKNKEFNQNFEESVYSKDGKKINFFNLGFKNKWQKLLPKDMVNKINNSLEKELLDLKYL